MMDALVTGRSIPALLAALDLLEIGLKVGVAVAENPGEPPWAPVHDPDGVVDGFLSRVSTPIPGTHPTPESDVRGVAVPPGRVWLVGHDGGWAPQAEPAVLGIPAVPLAAETLRLLGGPGATRAYLDRITPLLTVGKTREFGALVRKRLGGAALDLLVEPQVRDRFGVGASEVDASIAAPGLNEAMSRAGSLTAASLAYADRNVARETRLMPRGGGPALKRALLARLRLYDAQLIESPLASVERRAEGWIAAVPDGQVFEARSLVLDYGRSAEQPALFATIAPAIAPARVRTYSAIDVEPPEWLPVNDVGIRRHGDWTVRIEAIAGAPTRALLASPAVPWAEAGELGAAPLEAVLSASGLTPAPDSEAQHGFAAAAFATVAERQTAEAAIADASERDQALLVVGRALHGDDLAAALTSAHLGAVALRRRISGIAD